MTTTTMGLEMVPTYRIPREDGEDDGGFTSIDSFMRRDLQRVLRWTPEARMADTDGRGLRFVRGDDTLDGIEPGLSRGKRGLNALEGGGAIGADQVDCVRQYLAWMRGVYLADLNATGAPADGDDAMRRMLQESCQQAIADVRAVTDWLGT